MSAYPRFKVSSGPIARNRSAAACTRKDREVVGDLGEFVGGFVEGEIGEAGRGKVGLAVADVEGEPAGGVGVGVVDEIGLAAMGFGVVDGGDGFIGLEGLEDAGVLEDGEVVVIGAEGGEEG